MVQISVLILIITSISCSSNPSSGTVGVEQIDNDKDDVITLHNGLTFEVLLPPNYDTSETYPVLLLNDGENVFGSNFWNLDGLITTMIEENKIEPIITVAIHTNGNRNNWYLPYSDPWVTQNWGPYTPKAEEYTTLIFKGLIPYLAKEYSIEANNIGIMGYSLGGLISTWMGLKYPEKIKYSASLSGSFWVADYKIFEEVRKEYAEDQMFWFDIGTSEWNYYVPLYKNLQGASVNPGERSFYYEVPNGAHIPSDWKKRIHFPLILFFGTTEIVPYSMDVVLECIPSKADPRKKYRRMNPVITLTNDVKYSLAHTATYSMLTGDVQIGSEGSFINDPEVESKILVSFKGFSEQVIIPKGWCR